MNTSNDTDQRWARIRKRIASDVGKILKSTTSQSDQRANATAASVVRACAPRIARDIAAVATREIKQKRRVLDWSSWECIIEDAVHDSLNEATGGAPLASGILHWKFVNAVAERTGATLASEGMALVEPNWGADEPSCSWLARNVKKPARLAQMAEDILRGKVQDDGTVSAGLMHNPNLPFETARRLAKGWRPTVHFGSLLCNRPDATPEALAEWSEDLDPEVAEAVARHPNTNIETLRRMARSEQPWVVEAALSSGRLTEESFL